MTTIPRPPKIGLPMNPAFDHTQVRRPHAYPDYVPPPPALPPRVQSRIPPQWQSAVAQRRPRMGGPGSGK